MENRINTALTAEAAEQILQKIDEIKSRKSLKHCGEIIGKPTNVAGTK